MMCCFCCMGQFTGSNKAVSPPLHTPCAPVPRSHCTLASKCKHFRFAVDEPCCPRVVHFAFEVTLSLAIMLALLLVCSLSPKVQSIFWGPHIIKKRIKMMCCFCCLRTRIMQTLPKIPQDIYVLAGFLCTKFFDLLVKTELDNCVRDIFLTKSFL